MKYHNFESLVAEPHSNTNVLGETFCEVVNVEALKKMIYYDEILKDQCDRNGEVIVDQLRSMYSKLRKGLGIKHKFQRITYKTSFPELEEQKKCLGRFYSADGLISLGSIHRPVRHTLCDGLYIDLDMKNAHFNILRHICKRNGLPYENVDNYCNNRDKMLSDVMEYYKCDRDTAKKVFLMMCYGGCVESWKDKYGIKVKKDLAFLKELGKELKILSKIIYEKNEYIRKKADQKVKEQENKLKRWLESGEKCKKPKKKDKFRSSLAIFAQEKECVVLEVMLDFLISEGITTKTQYGYFSVLCYDGIMITDVKKKQLKDLESRMMDYIKKELDNFDCPIEIKPFDQKIDLSKYDIPTDKMIEDKLTKNLEWEPDENKLKYYDQVYCQSLGGQDYIQYQKKKKYIEKFLCKIQTPQVCYIFQNGEDREPHLYSLNDLNQLLKPITSGYVTDMGRPIAYTEKWLNDINHNCKRKYDFIPYNKDVETIDNDIYNMFRGYNKNIHHPYKEDRDKLVSPFLAVLKEICGGDEDCLNFQMKYFASMVQNPRGRPPVMCVWIDKQGSGKNVILDAIGRIISEEYYITSSNPKDFFGDYAEGFYRKLLVNLNECEGKDTFDFEGRIKSFITEDKIMVNPKFVRPTYIHNHAHVVVTTNKTNPLPIDVKSRDRRFFVVKGTGLYISKSKKWWSSVVNHFKKPEFISAMYDYLMSIDISNVNWDKDRPITKAYMDMAKRYAPIEALFIDDFICEKKWIGYGEGHCMLDDDESITEEEDENMVYNETKGYNKQQKIRSSDFYKCYKKFCESNGYYKKDIPNLKTFVGKITSELSLPVDYRKSHGINKWCFIPKEVMEYMKDKKWIMVDEEEIKQMIYLDDNNEQDDDEFLNDFGF